MRTVNFKGYWFGFSDVTLSTVLRKTRKINTLYSDISKLKIFFQQQRRKEIVISWTYLFMQQVCHKIGINFFHFRCFNFMVSIYWRGFLKLLIWVTNCKLVYLTKKIQFKLIVFDYFIFIRNAYAICIIIDFVTSTPSMLLSLLCCR